MTLVVGTDEAGYGPNLGPPVVAATALPACNDYPVYSLLESFEVRVTKKLSQREPIKLDYLWAALCMVGAVYFIFRSA